MTSHSFNDFAATLDPTILKTESKEVLQKGAQIITSYCLLFHQIIDLKTTRKLETIMVAVEEQKHILLTISKSLFMYFL